MKMRTDNENSSCLLGESLMNNNASVKLLLQSYIEACQVLMIAGQTIAFLSLS